MNLVQEKNNLPLPFLHFVHDGFQPFLKLAAEPGPGYHCAHVQGQHPLALERVGYVAAGDAGRQPLGNGRLAHAGLSDDDRVVLLAAGQGLGHPADFSVPPDDWVQLSPGGQLGQVDAVLLQGPVPALCPPVVDPVGAPNSGEGPVYPLLVNAELLDNPGRVPLGLAYGGDEQVLNADEFVLKSSRFLLGRVQQSLNARRGVNLAGGIGQLGRRVQQLLQSRLYGRGGNGQVVQNARRNAVLLVQHGQQHVLNIPLAVVIAPDQFLGVLDYL